jgi:branched-chain amino acid transport system substrate-binding protein
MINSTRNLTRRTTVALGSAAIATTVLPMARAADKVLHIPINMPFTGEEAEGATLVKNGAYLAIDEINAKGGVGGYRFEPVLMDDGTTNAGGYDPGQAATNARKMVNDPLALVALGPYNSGSGRQGDVVDPQRCQPGDHHPNFHQPRHNRSEIRADLSPSWSGDLFPHRFHGRVPGAKHGQLLCAGVEGAERLRVG